MEHHPVDLSRTSPNVVVTDTNFAMTAQTRAELMKKLAARSSSDLFGTEKPKPPAAVQTAAIRLTNMFVPEE